MSRDALGTLYLTVEETSARLAGDSVELDLPEKGRSAIPIQDISAIVAFDRCRVSLPLAMRCAELGKPVSLLSDFGELRARVAGPLEGSAELRMGQYGSYAHPARRLQLAREILGGKLQNSLHALARFQSQGASSAGQAIEACRDAGQRIVSAVSVQALLGAEGAASAAYFQAFGERIDPRLQAGVWIGRNRRPPRDPMNALLSFFASILTNECAGALETAGLDPAVGFLHELRPGRASLACDLVEEFRSPLVDRFCLGLAAKRVVGPDAFEERDGGVFLRGEGRRAALRAYENRKRRLVAHRDAKEPVPIGLLPFLQAAELARAIREQRPYRPAGHP